MSHPCRLSVNLNKVALLRNQRDLGYPSVTDMARLAVEAGAQGITAHPRPDERHIRPADIDDLATLLGQPSFESVEFNIEGYPCDSFLALVAKARPNQVTLVPDAPDQRTSDHGWSIPRRDRFLSDAIAAIKSSGARVSLFIDADPAMAEAACGVGADRVELYTGPYHHAFRARRAHEILPAYRQTAEVAHSQELGVNAGHDLNLDNLRRFLEAVPYIAEVSIGHALTADALTMGMKAAVRAYLDIIHRATAQQLEVLPVGHGNDGGS